MMKQFQRHELEAFLGEPNDFFVDQIVDDVTEFDSNGKLVWKDMSTEELNEICRVHQKERRLLATNRTHIDWDGAFFDDCKSAVKYVQSLNSTKGEYDELFTLWMVESDECGNVNYIKIDGELCIDAPK